MALYTPEDYAKMDEKLALIARMPSTSLGAGAKAGAYGLLSRLGHLAAATTPLDTTGWANRMAEEAAFNTEYAPGATSFADVANGGNTSDYLAFLLGSSLPDMALTMGGGGIGGLVARGALKRAAGAAVSDAALAAAARSGALRAGFASSLPGAAGDIAQNQYEAGHDYNGLAALAGAIPYAGLDVLLGGERAVLDAATGAAKSLARKSFADTAKQVAKSTLGTMLEEGAAETGQEVINQAFGRMATSNESLISPDSLSRYGESFIGGALLGGMMGGATHATGALLEKKLPTTKDEIADRALKIETPDLMPPAAPETAAPDLTQPLGGQTPLDALLQAREGLAKAQQAEDTTAAQERSNYIKLMRDADAISGHVKKAVNDVAEARAAFTAGIEDGMTEEAFAAHKANAKKVLDAAEQRLDAAYTAQENIQQQLSKATGQQVRKAYDAKPTDAPIFRPGAGPDMQPVVRAPAPSAEPATADSARAAILKRYGELSNADITDADRIHDVVTDVLTSPDPARAITMLPATEGMTTERRAWLSQAINENIDKLPTDVLEKITAPKQPVAPATNSKEVIQDGVQTTGQDAQTQTQEVTPAPEPVETQQAPTVVPDRADNTALESLIPEKAPAPVPAPVAASPAPAPMVSPSAVRLSLSRAEQRRQAVAAAQERAKAKAEAEAKAKADAEAQRVAEEKAAEAKRVAEEKAARKAKEREYTKLTKAINALDKIIECLGGAHRSAL